MTEKELKAEDIVKPLSPFDDISDEEILFWSTPYGLELEAKRMAHQEALKEEENKK